MSSTKEKSAVNRALQPGDIIFWPSVDECVFVVLEHDSSVRNSRVMNSQGKIRWYFTGLHEQRTWRFADEMKHDRK